MTQACINPFRWLDITAYTSPGQPETLQFAQCIRSWGGDQCIIAVIPLTDAVNMSADALWNVQQAVESRRQVREQGTAYWCAGCPRLAERNSPTEPYEAIDWNDLPKSWTTLNLAYDKSCNLACPSCRKSPICVQVGDDNYAALMTFQERVVEPLLRKAEWASVAGLGDPFGSPVYRHLLMTLTPTEAPKLRWHIQTNGLGFTREMIRSIPTWRQIESVQFSVDAATPDVYAGNRGGNWNRLLENLAFVSEMRRRGPVKQLAISMVVQENNWGQMTDFWRFGREHGVDVVQFNALLNQNTYDEAEYKLRAVHLPGHRSNTKFRKACDTIRTYTNPRVLLEMPRD